MKPQVREFMVRELAQQTVNTVPAVKIAAEAAQKIGVKPGAAFNELRFQLAYAYAQGYVQAWARITREKEPLVFEPERGLDT